MYPVGAGWTKQDCGIKPFRKLVCLSGSLPRSWPDKYAPNQLPKRLFFWEQKMTFNENETYEVEDLDDEDWKRIERTGYIAGGLLRASGDFNLSVFDNGVLAALCAMDDMGGPVIKMLAKRFKGETEDDLAASVHRLIGCGYIQYDNNKCWLDFDSINVEYSQECH